MSIRPKPTEPGDAPDLAHELDEAEPGPVEGDRDALLETDRHLDRLGRHRHGQREDVLGRCCPRVLEDAALDRPAPDVGVDRVDPVPAHRDGDVVLLGVVDRLLTAHAPDANRRHDLEVRRERPRPDLETDLVVALAGAPVSDGGGVVVARRGDEMTDDDRARQGRDERVAAFVERIGGERRHGEVAQQLLAGVDDHDLDGAGRRRALAERLEVDRPGRRRRRRR